MLYLQPPAYRQTAPRAGARQSGVALFVVIVFVMLSMLLALWGSRTSLFNELVVGNDADYQRALEAANALLLDAELDIRGEQSDGSACANTSPSKLTCRPNGGTALQIALDSKELSASLGYLDSLGAPYCQNGLCLKRTGKQDFWNDAATLKTMTTAASGGALPPGARFGQYTGASNGTDATPANPILADQSAWNRGGWYWIEVLPYDESAANSNLITDGAQGLLGLTLTPSVVYRITAVAFGMKRRALNTGETSSTNDMPVTMAVLQQTYAQQRLKN